MKKVLIVMLTLIIFSNCENAIKNENAQVEIEVGTKTAETENIAEPTSSKTKETTKTDNDLLGFWVGYFKRKEDENVYNEKTVYVDEGFIWTRENKINISIDKIDGAKVIGHSVVAGNDRPFEGTVEERGKGVFSFNVKEPGDDKYDGEFTFIIENNELKGSWKAYKKINIQERKYTLEKRSFEYNPNIMLEEGRYINWNKFKEEKGTYEGADEFEEWVSRTYSSATNSIYELNASNKLLTKKEVENLKKGDLLLIRNTIYARHGYSFKNRPLRVFFDAQNWYIPVHADIKSDFTKIEKKNIELLLRYEGNAAEYYDHFGRG
jgi:hypothetical protein